MRTTDELAERRSEILMQELVADLQGNGRSWFRMAQHSATSATGFIPNAAPYSILNRKACGTEARRSPIDSDAAERSTPVRTRAALKSPLRPVQSDGPSVPIDGQSAGHQSPCGSVVCPTSMM